MPSHQYQAASEARATAEAKLEESEAKKEEAIEEKSKAVDAVCLLFVVCKCADGW